ncbi:hypothetical protein CA13_44180 [Planctomycetes bacterium CA13]|uniref:Uncharacterized protein n=2 Tax=Novipirellula herctigrandis TaxID=2527986 RepID=A0A5C5Z6V1_9BACT|nr:hypothetical protein CA13_44180 [Planctomycetes bacterium CA13]
MAFVVCFAVFMIVFTLDRFGDTPATIRLGFFLGAVVICLMVLYRGHRWVWDHRRPDQLAKLVRQRRPGLGDQLLGVVELAQSDSEQTRSGALCAAAMQQVAQTASRLDLIDASPPSRTRPLGVALLAVVGLAVMTSIFAGDAAKNTWARLAFPWRDTPRFTFTTIEPIASTLIVPHGESVRWLVSLDETSQWKPSTASLAVGELPGVAVSRQDRTYAFNLPSVTEPTQTRLTIGDYHQIFSINPKLRPALVAIGAQVEFPEYLQRPQPTSLEVRGGIVAALKGSRVTVHATASQPLASATSDDVPLEIVGDTFTMPPLDVDSQEIEQRIEWQDHDRVCGAEPFRLSIKPLVDQPPSIAAVNWPKNLVLLHSELIRFETLAVDDFGIKRIGIEWCGLDDRNGNTATGERTIARGGPEMTSLELPATFSAGSLGIEPQPIELRLWAEDYLPNRQRAYSMPLPVTLLSNAQHAQWMTNRLSLWQQSAFDIRDREMRLHQRNEQLRQQQHGANNEALRDELRQQAAAETANARRLSELTKAGETLLRQAAKNTDVAAEQVEEVAEMIQVLQDIATHRMPSVADLLEKASAMTQSKNQLRQQDDLPIVGENRMKSRTSSTSSSTEGQEEGPEEGAEEEQEFPSIVDQESSQQAVGESKVEETSETTDSEARLDLAATTIAGSKASQSSNETHSESEESTLDEVLDEVLDEAIEEQAELLAEFKRLADEMHQTLVKLEGSTFVKRLKAASRTQDQIAERLAAPIEQTFGETRLRPLDQELFGQIAQLQQTNCEATKNTVDDMHAFYDRRQLVTYRLVLAKMEQETLLPSLEQLRRRIPNEPGLSIAQAEYWCDALDQWADALVESPDGDSDPDAEKTASLPVAVILEVLRILEQEVNLREQTRAAEQYKVVAAESAYQDEATRLSQVQQTLRGRVESVIADLEAVPEGNVAFEDEINLMLMVAQTMNEAASILASPDTAGEAIAAESEAIELLLRSKRTDPSGGTDAGTDPSGGGQGDAANAALALIGAGLNASEQLRESEAVQSTGVTGQTFPEEFRAGLDEYFRQLEESR